MQKAMCHCSMFMSGNFARSQGSNSFLYTVTCMHVNWVYIIYNIKCTFYIIYNIVSNS